MNGAREARSNEGARGLRAAPLGGRVRCGARAIAGPSCAVLLALLLAPAGASAWVRSAVPGTGTCLFWPTRQLAWTLEPTQTDGVELPALFDAVRASFATWQAEGCTDLSFVELGTTSSRSIGWHAEGANENALLVRAATCAEVAPASAGCHADGGCSNEYDCWDHDGRVIAVTTSTFDEVTGRVVDADVELNGPAWRFTASEGAACGEGETQGCVATDVQNTVTHELGHVLGLDHTPIQQATMYASAPIGELEKRTLDTDDVEALCTIYPAGGATLTCKAALVESPTVYGGCGCSGGQGGVGAAAWIAMLLLGLRRQRR